MVCAVCALSSTTLSGGYWQMLSRKWPRVRSCTSSLVESPGASRPTACASRIGAVRGATQIAARAVSAAPAPHRRLTRSRFTQQFYGSAYSLQGEGEARMTRMTVLTLLALLPIGGAAQRGDWLMPG